MPTYTVTFKEGQKQRTKMVESFTERDAAEIVLQEGHQVLKVAEFEELTKPEPRRQLKPFTQKLYAISTLLAIGSVISAFMDNFIASEIGGATCLLMWSVALLGSEVNRWGNQFSSSLRPGESGRRP